MAETLLAIVLATSSSSKGSNIVFRWPPTPVPSIRLSRAIPEDPSQPDNPWRSTHSTQSARRPSMSEDDPRTWSRRETINDTGSARSSSTGSPPATPQDDEYEHILGYTSDLLATVLFPPRGMFHQKFELILDDLALLGHPTCSDVDGVWRFRPDRERERERKSGRGRVSRGSGSMDDSMSPEPSNSQEKPGAQSTWLERFHLVLVLDLPDPSSSASGSVAKYFDVVYEQIVFPMTAVLFQEQVLHNFVEAECDVMGSIKDSCTSKSEPFASFVSECLATSSIASSMKTLYDAIKASSIVCITLNHLPLELQLPPYLDSLLHSEDDNDAGNDVLDSDDAEAWGPEFTYGWRVPALAPWKSLLLLGRDAEEGVDPLTSLREGTVEVEDGREFVEGLVRFLENVSVIVSLADMASLLDWDLEDQVFPIVRWLVLHRRAKVVDRVHASLKTVFTLPPTFGQSLGTLSTEFRAAFPSLPTLPSILSTIGASQNTHLYASVVRAKELIPVYHDVVLWMLRRDMLVTLHLRVRVVATHEVKLRVRLAREHQHRVRKDRAEGSVETASLLVESEYEKEGMLFASARAASLADADGEDEGGGMGEDSGWETGDDDSLWPSIISDPSRATPRQRRWLSAMSEGKDPQIARRFEQISQYFDGKKTDDEILYRAGITRKQLREVIHHYETYLQTFLHPS